MGIPRKAALSYQMGILPKLKIKVKAQNAPRWESLPPPWETTSHWGFDTVLFSQLPSGDTGEQGFREPGSSVAGAKETPAPGGGCNNSDDIG